jgi:hypothetical protein
VNPSTNALTSSSIAHASDQEGSSCRWEECRSYAKVFRLSQDGLTWEPLGSILSDMMFNFEAGWAVALAADGLTAAVSAPSLYRSDGGSVRVYTFDTDSSDWIQIGQTIFGQVRGAACGFSVDLSADGKTLAIGAPFAFNQTGYAEVRTFNEDSEEWEMVGEPLASEVGDKTGYRVVLSADASILAVSYAGYKPVGDNRFGLVRAFHIPNGQTEWEQLGSDILPAEDNPDEIVGGSYGDGLSLGMSSDGQTLVVGAPAASFNCIIPGLARVFRFSEGDWNQIGSGIDAERRYNEEDSWGTDFVAISGNGERLVVGSPLPEPNWGDVLVSCPDFDEVLVESVRVFNLGIATMPPSTKPTLAPTSIPTLQPTVMLTSAPTSIPTSQPTVMPTLAPMSITSAPTNIPTLQPTVMPTLAPSFRTSSNSIVTAQPTTDTSAAFTKGSPCGFVVMSSVAGTFLLFL